jgi:hypothetical protein
VLTDDNPRAQKELAAIQGYEAAVKALIQDPSVPIRIRTLLAGIDASIPPLFLVLFVRFHVCVSHMFGFLNLLVNTMNVMNALMSIYAFAYEHRKNIERTSHHEHRTKIAPKSHERLTNISRTTNIQ